MNITIPPEALEAGARKMQNLLFCNNTDGEQIARACFLAMVKAWPDMAHRVLPYAALILPLTEKPDDKA